MNSPPAILNKILPYSVVDGPGNRLVLFFQGCNFTCATCHNPYTIGVCDHCGDCITACHAGALKMVANKVVFNPELCDQCDACLEACPISSSPMTTTYSIEQVLEIIRTHLPFLSGITVSGGEATLHLKFVKELFETIKTMEEFGDLTCFIDTNGHLGEKAWTSLLPVTDGVMLDIKAFGTGVHQGLTGQNNQKTLLSAEIVNRAGKLHELRYLLVPGKNDMQSEIKRLIDFTLALNPDIRVRLNAFQHHGVRGAALDWPTMGEERTREIAAQLTRAGIKNVIVPAIFQ